MAPSNVRHGIPEISRTLAGITGCLSGMQPAPLFISRRFAPSFNSFFRLGADPRFSGYGRGIKPGGTQIDALR
jgi:hypothetical protein